MKTYFKVIQLSKILLSSTAKIRVSTDQSNFIEDNKLSTYFICQLSILCDMYILTDLKKC